jgi:hypothetical protein
VTGDSIIYILSVSFGGALGAVGIFLLVRFLAKDHDLRVLTKRSESALRAEAVLRGAAHAISSRTEGPAGEPTESEPPPDIASGGFSGWFPIAGEIEHAAQGNSLEPLYHGSAAGPLQALASGSAAGQ